MQLQRLPVELLCQILSRVEFSKEKIRWLRVNKAWHDALCRAESHRIDILPDLASHRLEERLQRVLPFVFWEHAQREEVGGWENVQLVQCNGEELRDYPQLLNLRTLNIDIVVEEDGDFTLKSAEFPELEQIHITVVQLRDHSKLERFLREDLTRCPQLTKVSIDYEEGNVESVPEIRVPSGCSTEIYMYVYANDNTMRALLAEVPRATRASLSSLDVQVVFEGSYDSCSVIDLTSLGGCVKLEQLWFTCETDENFEGLFTFTNIGTLPHETVVTLKPSKLISADVPAGWHSRITGDNLLMSRHEGLLARGRSER